MRFMNKSLGILIMLSMLLTTFNFASAAGEKTYATEVQFLQSIEVLSNDFDSDAKMSKGEFTAIVAKILNPNIEFSGAVEGTPKIFNDVENDDPFYGQIKLFKDMGIVSGDRDNNFNPDKSITYNEAIVIVIRALGYTSYAQAQGGYPGGYHAVANSSGISKGIKISSDAELTGAEAGKIIYNSLFADLVSFGSISDGEVNIEISKGNNILSESLGIREYDAVVIDDGVTSLTDKSIDDLEKAVLKEYKSDKIMTVYVGQSDLQNYLGCRVKVFVKNNDVTGRNEVVFSKVYSDLQQIVLNSDFIVNIMPSYIEYEETKNSGNYKKINLGNFSPVVVYNGERLISYPNDIFKPQDGLVKFVDNNNDKVYETVIITSFNYENGNFKSPAKNIVVDNVDLENNYIHCGFNPSNNLDLNPDKTVYKFINSDKTLKDINPKDIISVAKSPKTIDGKEFYYLAVSSEREIVSISSYSEKELYTDKKDYVISSSVLDIKPNFAKNLKTNDETTIFLDSLGKVAYATGPNQTKNYGYLIGATINNTYNDTVKVKLFTKDGKIDLYEISSNALIDGKKFSTGAEQFAALKTRPAGADFMGDDVATQPIARPVLYEVNAKKIVMKLDTDTPNYATVPSGSNITNAYSNQYYIKYSNEEIDDVAALKAAFRSPRTSEYKKTARSMEGKFCLNNETLVINVPDIDTYGINKHTETNSDNQAASKYAFNYDLIKLYEASKNDYNYKIINVNDFDYRMMYDMQAYDIDKDTGIAGLVVLRGRMDAYGYNMVPYSATYPIYTFDRISTVYDESQEKEITRLYYLRDGKTEMSVLLDKDELLYYYKAIIFGCNKSGPLNVSVKPLMKGDLIRVMQSKGYLTHIERVSALADIKANSSSTLYPVALRSLYSTTASGGVGFEKGMPFDARMQYYGGNTQSYQVSTVYPKSIKGNNMKVLFGFDTLSKIDLSDMKTYAEQYINIGTVPIIVITVDKNKEVKVKEGTTADIKTYEDTKDFNKTSILITKMTDFKIDQFFVINGHEFL